MDHASPEPGDEQQIAGRYQLIKMIGAGGYARVYEAYDPLLDRCIALKILSLEQSQDLNVLQQRFVREYKVISRLKHANIVQVYAFDWNDGQACIAMEMLNGRTLEVLLAQEGPFNQERFRQIFLPLLDAFDYAHQLRLIHRDIKPDNIMIVRDTDEVKILDFGLSSILEPDRSELTQTSVCGSPYYMSPEQCSGASLDQRSDIYSLACVMYKALLGQAPFQGETAAETMYLHLHGQLVVSPEITVSRKIPQSLYSVLQEALSKDPAKRPQSMTEFKQKIESALNSKRYISAARSSDKKYLAVVCIFSLLLLLGTAIAYASFSAGQAKKDKKTAAFGIRKKKFMHVSEVLNQARLMKDSGRPEEALKFLQEFESKIEPNSIDRFGSFSVYSRLGYDAREIARAKAAPEARELLQLALSYYDKAAAYCDSPTRMVENLGSRLELFELFGNNKEAGQELQRVKRLLETKSSEPDIMAIACWHYFMARHLSYLGSKKEAAEEYLKALEWFDKMPCKRTEMCACQSSVDLIELSRDRIISTSKANEELHRTISDLDGNPYKSETYSLAGR